MRLRKEEKGGRVGKNILVVVKNKKEMESQEDATEDNTAAEESKKKDLGSVKKKVICPCLFLQQNISGTSSTTK